MYTNRFFNGLLLNFVPDKNLFMAPGQHFTPWFRSRQTLRTDRQDDYICKNGKHVTFCSLSSEVEHPGQMLLRYKLDYMKPALLCLAEGPHFIWNS